MSETLPASAFITAGLLPQHAPYVDATRCWVDRAVVDLNLCPFAAAPMKQRRIRYAVSDARDADSLLEDLLGELLGLHR